MFVLSALTFERFRLFSTFNGRVWFWTDIRRQKDQFYTNCNCFMDNRPTNNAYGQLKWERCQNWRMTRLYAPCPEKKSTQHSRYNLSIFYYLAWRSDRQYHTGRVQQIEYDFLYENLRGYFSFMSWYRRTIAILCYIITTFDWTMPFE